MPHEQALTEVAERRLAHCGRLPPGIEHVEVLDFGVSGYGTAQELLTLRDHALAFDPDVVVLVFYAGNDVRNNSRQLEEDHPERPFAVRDARRRPDLRRRLPPRPRLSAAHQPAGERGVRRRRVLPPGAARGVRVAAPRRPAAPRQAVPGRASATGGAPPRLVPSPDDEVYRQPPRDPRWAAAWAVSEALIRQVAADSRAAGARFLLVSASTGVQAYPDVGLRRDFAASLRYPICGGRSGGWPPWRGVRVSPTCPWRRRSPARRRGVTSGSTARAASATGMPPATAPPARASPPSCAAWRASPRPTDLPRRTWRRTIESLWPASVHSTPFSSSPSSWPSSASPTMPGRAASTIPASSWCAPTPTGRW